MPSLFGTLPSQCPTNGDLGTLAFQDANAVKITGGEVTAVQKTDTAISETNPSLNLDFANTKSLDPRITFTRNTTATYYDGKTVAKAEENLALYSNQFNTTWNYIGASVINNSGTAPDGTVSATLLTEGTSVGTHRTLFNQLSATNGLVYTFSVFAKAGTKSNVQLYYGAVVFGSNAYANFDLVSGSVGTIGSSATASITNIGNGWYRCSVSATASATGSDSPNIAVVQSSTAARAESYTGSSQTIYLWGAQLEQRSAVSSYTPTTSSPVTNYIPALQTCPVNSARFDHDPVTGESKGLLIEEQRTNLLVRSDDFNDATWVKSDVVIVSNTVVAPDGTLTGDKVYESATNANHRTDQTVSVISGTTYTYSVFAKKGERQSVKLEMSGTAFGNASRVTFNLNTGTVQNSTGSPASSSITSMGNGWYRCSVTSAATSTGSGRLWVMLGNSDSGEAISYAGDGYSGLYIWGAQLEAGAFPTSYIPTTDQQKTRSADVASITGTNFSSWYRQDEGTVYCESATVNFSSNRGIWAIGDGQSFSSGNFMYEIYDSGVSGRRLVNSYTKGISQVANFGPVAIEFVNVASKGTFAYATNNFAVTSFGLSPATDMSGSVANSVTALSIGNLSAGWSGGSTYLNGTIKKLTYFPKRLSNDELVEMTS